MFFSAQVHYPNYFTLCYFKDISFQNRLTLGSSFVGSEVIDRMEAICETKSWQSLCKSVILFCKPELCPLVPPGICNGHDYHMIRDILIYLNLWDPNHLVLPHQELAAIAVSQSWRLHAGKYVSPLAWPYPYAGGHWGALIRNVTYGLDRIVSQATPSWYKAEREGDGLWDYYWNTKIDPT